MESLAGQHEVEASGEAVALQDVGHCGAARLVNLLWTLCLVRFACLVNLVVDSMSGLPVL